MKVESISIQNFKKFESLAVSFKNKTLDEVGDRFLVLGDNGTGKTTLLQAIALPLALATGRIRSIADFDWIGFLPGRYWRWGTPRIELEVSFEQEETVRRGLDVAFRMETIERANHQYQFLILDICPIVAIRSS